MDIEELTGRVHHPFAVIARLRSDASMSQAQAELSTLAYQAEISFPATNKNFGVTVHRLEDSSAAKMRQALLALFAAVGLVLLIACTNIVNLLLARCAARQREVTLRTAIGASRTRIVRQLLTENLLLFTLGATLGLVLAIAGLSALRNSIPPDFASVKGSEAKWWRPFVHICGLCCYRNSVRTCSSSTVCENRFEYCSERGWSRIECL